MRIACITTSRVPSSTANSIQAMKTCHALAQNGHEVRLWLPGEKTAAWEVLADHYGLKTPFEITWLKSTPALKRYDFTWKALRQVRAWQGEVVYTWMAQAAVLGGKMGLPVIFEVHDLPTGKIGPLLFQAFVRSGGKKRLLAITRALLERLDQRYAVQQKGIDTLVAPNGVDLERYSNLPEAPEARRQLGLSEGFTAGYSGHFYAGRGSELLYGLARAFPQVHFLWVGGRPADVESWRDRFRKEGVTNITLTGFIENSRLPLYQAACEVLLMPYEQAIAGSSGGNSAEICSPMKMFDYLACGRAILTSDLAVFHEVLNDQNALFCAPGDLAAWKAAFERVSSDAVLRLRLGEQARREASKFSWRERAERALTGFEGV